MDVVANLSPPPHINLLCPSLLHVPRLFIPVVYGVPRRILPRPDAVLKLFIDDDGRGEKNTVELVDFFPLHDGGRETTITTNS